MVDVTTTQVWAELGKQAFAVVGMVSARGEGRTVGIVPTVHDGAIWFVSKEDSWKVAHLRANPEISVTVPIGKRVPFMPFVKIPAATITVAGTATVLPRPEVPAEVWQRLTRGLDTGDPAETSVGVRIVPHGDFVTYGVGTSLLGMRDTEAARGRAPVGRPARTAPPR
ncbi:pyridoxamine 5'-phosphate oxidase family protein [Actinotalea sp. M2MS4P-6]|uniref:pyridoxamine 5'-phosphate oxidase family protein n=1 Tax=Actinotalea sp. M2MS4P-6 TaxID=2983762 RepID=UPI0021E45752|nr:pyridoxamine 5'-phosphate oxidase family protein [Actinotalea sp. M2MS4P-6]MCV2394832.1 pyridoxamine 5'-phosphate oxidase family protein [Actinotalea sp. M2MS4P-6]